MDEWDKGRDLLGSNGSKFSEEVDVGINRLKAPNNTTVLQDFVIKKSKININY